MCVEHTLCIFPSSVPTRKRWSICLWKSNDVPETMDRSISQIRNILIKYDLKADMQKNYDCTVHADLLSTILVFVHRKIAWQSENICEDELILRKWSNKVIIEWMLMKNNQTAYKICTEVFLHLNMKYENQKKCCLTLMSVQDTILPSDETEQKLWLPSKSSACHRTWIKIKRRVKFPLEQFTYMSIDIPIAVAVFVSPPRQGQCAFPS